MTSTIDPNVLSSILSRLDIDNNVFYESQVPCSTSVATHVASRPPLHPSLSQPVDSFYPAELTKPTEAAASVLATRLPAPRLHADRRSQSMGDAGTLYPEIPSKSSTMPAPARYKTELCRPFEENGACRYGSKCQFAHGRSELRSVVRHPKYKTDLCRTFHTTGLCPYGPRCHFIHNDDERRSSESSTDQSISIRQLAVQQRDELGGHPLPIQQNPEPRPAVRLHRQFSEYQPRTAEQRQRGIPVAGNGYPGSDLQRRASTVADSVIRRSLHHRSLHPVLEADRQSALNVTTAARSLGSVADSFSPSSSVTDSPSPSPTAGLLLPPAEDPVTPTPADYLGLPAPAAWRGEGEQARAALLAELVSRLGLGDIAALLRAFHVQGNPVPDINLSPRVVDGTAPQDSVPGPRHSELWEPCHQRQYEHQPRGPVTSNVCW